MNKLAMIMNVDTQWNFWPVTKSNTAMRYWYSGVSPSTGRHASSAVNTGSKVWQNSWICMNRFCPSVMIALPVCTENVLDITPMKRFNRKKLKTMWNKTK